MVCKIPNYKFPAYRQAGKSQISSKFQFQMAKLILFRIWIIGICLLFGLPARSRYGEGRCLGFGALEWSYEETPIHSFDS